MRLLFITDNFPPEVNAPATRTHEHCVEWTKQGVEVTIITCAPNYPQGKVYAGYENKLYQTETIDGIKVIRVWSYISANEGFIKRILDYISFAVMAFWVGLFIKTDIIVATSPQFFTTLTGYALSIFKWKPWVFELRDLWPESIRATNAMQADTILDALEKLELFLYKKATKVIPVTDAFKTNLIKRGIAANKIEVVTNGSNLELFKTQGKNQDLLTKLGLQNKFVVGYIGTHGMAHSLDFIMQSLPHVKDETIHFLFIGDGAEKKRVRQMAQDLKLENVTFLDPIPKRQIPEYIALTDITLVPLKRSDTFKTVIPSKIFEAASMQKPILLGVDGEARGIVQTHDAGLYFVPEDTDSFLSVLQKMKDDTVLYQRLQTGCHHLAQAYDRKMLANKMLDILKKCI